MAKVTHLVCLCTPLCMLTAIVVVVHAVRPCPKLTPVPIDENFLFKRQPTDGFYSTYTSGEHGVPSYTPKKMNKKAIAGPHPVCFFSKVKISGNDMLNVPPADCTYKTPSLQFCHTGPDGPTGAALAAAGIRIPVETALVIVDTDNSTYYALAFCADGALYEWAILTTDPRNRQVRSRTAKALSLTLAQVKEGSSRRFQFTRIGFEKGECSSSAKIMAGVTSVRNTLGGLGLGRPPPPAPPLPPPQPPPVPPPI